MSDSPAFGPGDALLVVDVQNDFLPGGSLAVPEGDTIIPILNEWVERASSAGIPVILTRDWHPPHHISFQEKGGPWPPHCIQETPGAAFAPNLAVPEDAVIISKAMDLDVDAYSGFDGTELANILREMNVRRVWIGGLATDVCVRATTLDAIEAGFKAALIPDGHRGITPEGIKEALGEMAEAGAEVDG